MYILPIPKGKKAQNPQDFSVSSSIGNQRRFLFAFFKPSQRSLQTQGLRSEVAS